MFNNTPLQKRSTRIMTLPLHKYFFLDYIGYMYLARKVYKKETEFLSRGILGLLWCSRNWSWT